MKGKEKTKTRNRKKALIIVTAVILALAVIIGACNLWAAVEGNKVRIGGVRGYRWSAEDDYSAQKTTSLEMDGDYKIMLLTDVHLKNSGTFASWLGINYLLDGVSKIALNRLVERENPDLILVLGDTVLTKRNDMEYERFVKQMDGYKKPWACVFGNHDDEGRADKAALADVLSESEYGLFDYGPHDLHGAGNYVLELKRGGNTQYALFMMDSGSSLEFDEGTDGINEAQLRWYDWNMEAFRSKLGYTPKNMAFFHIPTKEYAAIRDYEQGARKEDGSSGNTDAGIVGAMIRNGGTHIFAGHDHSNNFIADYGGIKLGYATKSSYNCYFTSGMTGATILTIDGANDVTERIVNF